MPSIIIKEFDDTTLAADGGRNFTVVVPGFCSNAEPKGFDENGLQEFTDKNTFKTNIGLRDAVDGHKGNQIVYELLSMGYKVLFKKMNNEPTLDKAEFWEPLKDKSLYDFRFIISGFDTYSQSNNNICKQMTAVAAARGDCVAICDIDPAKYSSTKTQKENYEAIATEAKAVYNAAVAAADDSKYFALVAPWVTYTTCSSISESTYNNNKTFPASFHYLACAMKAKKDNFAEWFAVAGYQRGLCKYTVSAVGCELGEAAVDYLQRRKASHGTEPWVPVNIVTKIRGTYYLWGNRTGFALDDKDLRASHFLNIRQLSNSIKKTVYDACKKFTFDPNSDVLWINFCNEITPLLETMKADQGIRDYRVIQVLTDKKAVMRAIIRIVPIEAVEDFEIQLHLENNIEGDIAFIED